VEEVMVPPALAGLSPCGASQPSASSGLSTIACNMVMRWRNLQQTTGKPTGR